MRIYFKLCIEPIELVKRFIYQSDIYQFDMSLSKLAILGALMEKPMHGYELRKYFEHAGLQGTLQLGNGEALHFEDNTFDVVYAHGVIQ